MIQVYALQLAIFYQRSIVRRCPSNCLPALVPWLPEHLIYSLTGVAADMIE